MSPPTARTKLMGLDMHRLVAHAVKLFVTRFLIQVRYLPPFFRKKRKHTSVAQNSYEP